MVPAEPTLRQVAVRTVAGAVTPHLRVVDALIPPPAADVAILLRVAVAATAADIDKLTLLVSPKSGAAAGTSTQPAVAPAFLF